MIACDDNDNHTVLVDHNMLNPRDLAVDWIHGLLFWTDEILKTVNVMDLNTTQYKVLFKEDIFAPKAIAVDPSKGLIFWVLMGRIERASMDGNDRMTRGGNCSSIRRTLPPKRQQIITSTDRSRKVYEDLDELVDYVKAWSASKDRYFFARGIDLLPHNITPMMVSRAIKRFEETDKWPPSSPDLNSLDYAVWSILEEKACAKPHPTVESLKRALIKVWDEIKVETLRKVVDDFPNQLKAYVEADGGHFE
uniref:Uncharacterized protein n=1 Tax=Acrobeloides nanus TaxID=290746 RepID=A0A914CMQ3_9BILA